VHEYASGLTPTSKAELFCRCKHRTFIGQKIGCPHYHYDCAYTVELV